MANKINLILPVAGESKRFGANYPPKWLIKLPNSNLMIEEALDNLDLFNVNKVIIIYRIKDKKYFNENFLKNKFEKRYKKNFIFLSLSIQTQNQPHTIYLGLKKIKLKNSPIFIKDCDSVFKFKPINQNSVCYESLSSIEFINAKSKSYIEINNKGHLSNIVEKHVISENFNVGGYSFSSSDDFMLAYKELRKNKSLYVSHIIFKLILDGKIFRGVKTTSFVDLGTERDLLIYKNSFKTFVINFNDLLDNPNYEDSLDNLIKKIDLNKISKIKKKLSNTNYKLFILISKNYSKSKNIHNFFKKQKLDYRLILDTEYPIHFIDINDS